MDKIQSEIEIDTTIKILSVSNGEIDSICFKNRVWTPEKIEAENKPKKETKKQTTYKVCRVCNQKKPISEFHKRNDSIDGHYNKCKKCNYEYHKDYMKRKKKEQKNQSEKKDEIKISKDEIPLVNSGTKDKKVLNWNKFRIFG